MPKRKDASREAARMLVDEFLAGKTRSELRWDSVDPTGSISKAMEAMNAAMRGERPVADALARFRAVDLGAVGAPDAAVILLEGWLRAVYGAKFDLDSPAGTLAEMEAIVRRIKRLVTPPSSPEIRIVALFAEALLANARGDRNLHLDLLKQAIAIPRAGSLWHRRAVMRLTNALANLGRLTEAEPLLQGFPTESADREIAFVEVYRFIDAVEGVRTGEALGLMQSLRASQILKSNRRVVGSYVALCDWLATRWAADRNSPLPQEDPQLLPWAQVMEHLLARRPEAALTVARGEAAALPNSSTRRTAPDAWNLLRAELSCRNGDAARRLLVQRRGIGNVHHLDDFFLARIELLAGNREAAARHFAAASAACERFRSLGRLDFELRMSCELSAADACWLGRATAESAQQEPSAVTESRITPPAEPRGTDRLIGHSRALLEVKAAVQRIAPVETPVLITGETGTGKELVARAIHDLSPNGGGPFVAVNCGAIAESLLETELFGHERGAFTGAQSAHRGIFEAAGGGTVLLDEIGDVSPRLQAALLRVLEAGEIRPVGSARSRRISCRVVAATNADLNALVEDKRFRPDLLYRLQRLQIQLPALRERPEDILPLAEHFLSEGRRDGLRPAMSREVQEWLLARKWPGNVRELRNVVERMRLLNSEKLHYGLQDLTLVDAQPPGADSSGRPAETEPATSAAAGSPEAAGAAQALPASPEPADVERFLRGRRTPLRRMDFIRDLFRRHGKFTRAELAEIAGVSPFTIGRDLKLLLAEGLIEKVQPTAAARTHYFRLRSS